MTREELEGKIKAILRDNVYGLIEEYDAGIDDWFRYEQIDYDGAASDLVAFIESELKVSLDGGPKK